MMSVLKYFKEYKIKSSKGEETDISNLSLEDQVNWWLYGMNISEKDKSKTAKISLEDGTRWLLSDMETNMTDMSKSKFYRKMVDQLRKNPYIQSNIKRVLGLNKQVKVIIYALDSIELSYVSQCQLSMMMLLKHEFDWIGDVEVFDPAFSPIDCKVMEKLGCNVLSINEHCARKVEKPTLFFMPYAYLMHRANLLQTNWSPAQLNQIILLSDSDFNSPKPLDSQWNNYEMYKGILHRYATSFKVSSSERMYNGKEGIGEFFWSFFNVDSQTDMETLLPDDFTMEKIRGNETKFPEFYKRERIKSEIIYQAAFEFSDRDYSTALYYNQNPPLCFRSSWTPPQPGWIKLNFSGKVVVHGRNKISGYGGILQDEFKHCLGIYSGNLGKLVDSEAASLEALRQGLRNFLQFDNDGVKGLVVEGDDFSVIRWVTCGPEPPRKLHTALFEVYDMLENINPVVYHVYKEANGEAIELAERGAHSNNPS